MTDTTAADSDRGGSQAGEQGETAEPPRYDPLREYDPRREFGYIETARAEIDQNLLGFTTPFATGVIVLIRLSTLAVVWSAGVIPLLEALAYGGFMPASRWHAAIILGVPIGVLLFVLGWLFIRLPIKLKWAEVYLEMYLDDEVSNLLIRQRDACRGELKGIHMGSNVALLRLLRLRMKAFHFWHRISIHAFILNGMFFRRFLETPFISPRLWANGVPVVTLAIFLSVQAGILMGSGVSGGLLEMAQAYFGNVCQTLVSLRLGGAPGGPPTVAFMAAGFGIAWLAYWLSRQSRHRVVARLETFLDTTEFLNPHTHDSSREILAKHEKLIRILARILARGRNGDGGIGSEELSELILDEGLLDGADDLH